MIVIVEPNSLTEKQLDVLAEHILEALTYGKKTGVWPRITVKGFKGTGKPIYEVLKEK